MLPLCQRIGARAWSFGGIGAAWGLFGVALAAVVVSHLQPRDATVAEPAWRATASVADRSGQLPSYITCFDNDPIGAAQAADALAERYAADRRGDWRQQAAFRCAVARAHTEKARRDEDQATVRWLRAEQRANESACVAGEQPVKKHGPDGSTALVGASHPATIENPHWAELQRQVTELEQRRAKLLVRDTPLHPAVLDVDARIEAVKSELHSTPPKIPNPAVPAARLAGAPDGQVVSSAASSQGLSGGDEDTRRAERARSRVSELSATLESAHRARQQAELAEQQAVAQRDAGPRLVIAPAHAVPNRTEPAAQRLPLFAWTSLGAGLLMAVGIGLVSVGWGMEPPLASLQQLEVDLGGTPIHAIETNDPLPNYAGLKSQESLARTAIAVGWCLLLVFSSCAICL